jgi:hypothetical protein
MDHSHQMAGQPVPAAARPIVHAAPPRPALSLVSARFVLAEPSEPAPEAWRAGLDALLGWLGIAAEIVPAAAMRPRGLARMAEWAMPPAAAAPVFAPWIGWSPAAFQHGGLPGLPRAQFVASYLIDHARGQASGQGGADLMLLSPHPATCTAEAAGDVPTPRASVMKAMLRAIRAEGRARIAVIVGSRQRNTVARQMLAAGKAVTGENTAFDLLTIEEALPQLIAGPMRWDAVIVMPEWRSTVFTLLGETSGLRVGWPMLWFDAAGGLTSVTSEAPGEGLSRRPLDAPALIHALALTLHHCGAGRAAARLHEGWARLRDSGVTTFACGAEAPYAKRVDDAAFLDLLVQDAAVSKRPQTPWRALKNAEIAKAGSQTPPLRVVASNPALLPNMKGR